jgi:predicted dehydrogenase
MIFTGTEGRIEVLIPFNAPNDRPTRLLLDDETIEFPICDQYEIQGTLFSRAIREYSEQPIPLEDAINNMTVIDAVFRSATSSQWEEVQ